jgi:3'-phosphoadenosine 5'-phosphosulfate sulfotransferase (PAPS reductase)/FAD synthetase
MDNQVMFPGWQDYFLERELEWSRKVVRKANEATKAAGKPLIIQFSGGRDSMAVLALVREVTDNFYCAYMCTGTEFPGFVKFVRDICSKLGVKLLISVPNMHKGNIYQRIERFQSFPNLGRFEGGGKRLWCCRDLKLRPEKKLLYHEFGRGTFFRLEGIRRFESARRQVIYKPYAENPFRPDDELKGSFEVYPILNWTDEDVLRYLEMTGMPTTGLYKEFGVSGCSWCPFYGPDIYLQVLATYPTHYDQFIELEEKLKIPSVQGGVWLKDLKRQVTEGIPAFIPKLAKLKAPCTIVWEGKRVPTCDIYGHSYVDGECLRCGDLDPKPVFQEVR